MKNTNERIAKLVARTLSRRPKCQAGCGGYADGTVPVSNIRTNNLAPICYDCAARDYRGFEPFTHNK